MENVINIDNSIQYLVKEERITNEKHLYFAWIPTKTGAGNWIWFRPFLA